jgi:hypothetical protein
MAIRLPSSYEKVLRARGLLRDAPKKVPTMNNPTPEPNHGRTFFIPMVVVGLLVGAGLLFKGKDHAHQPSVTKAETTSRITPNADSRTLDQSTTPAVPSTDDSRYYDPTYRPAVGYHYVRGYFRRDGTYVRGHYRTNRDNSFYNNWSTRGNVNPFTGRVGTKQPPTSSYSRR